MKTMRSRLCLAAVLAASAPAGARAGEPSFAPLVEEHRLANGMRIVLAPDAALGDVNVLVQYGVGSADDPARVDAEAVKTPIPKVGFSASSSIVVLPMVSMSGSNRSRMAPFST